LLSPTNSEEQGDIPRIYSIESRAKATPDEIQNAVSASRLVKDRFVFFSGAKVQIVCEI